LSSALLLIAGDSLSETLLKSLLKNGNVNKIYLKNSSMETTI
jgi:hypothetical protein